jgi:hypothetical protein
MECNLRDIFTLLLIILLVGCIFSSLLKLNVINTRCRKITGGKITEVVDNKEIQEMLVKNQSIQNVGKYNYNFVKNQSEVMDITASVVTKK